MSLPPEIQKKIKLLELATRRRVNNIFAGEYHSAFKGQGMTFSEFREYVPGDDVRTISWPLMARTGKPYIKKFDEEREMILLLAVDISGSSDFGTHQYFKGETIAHLAALLGFAASRSKDPVGLLLFTDQVEHYVPPKKGSGQIHRILRDLYYFKPKSRGTKIGAALEFLQGVLKKKAHVFILSDFMDKGFDMPLRMMGKRHDTVAVVVRDPAEVELPNVGLMDLHDAESGETITVDTSSEEFRKHYAIEVKRRRDQQDQELLRSQVERIEVRTDGDLVQPLVEFFHRRSRR